MRNRKAEPTIFPSWRRINYSLKPPYPKSLAINVNRIQMIIPVTVGSAAARAVHFKLPVSFLMVRSVVEQGQCIREKSIVLMAVIQVQPLLTKSSLICERLSSSRMLPCAV